MKIHREAHVSTFPRQSTSLLEPIALVLITRTLGTDTRQDVASDGKNMHLHGRGRTGQDSRDLSKPEGPRGPGGLAAGSQPVARS